MEVGWSEVQSPTWATALEPAVRALSEYLLGFTSFCANLRQGYSFNARLNREVDSVQFLNRYVTGFSYSFCQWQFRIGVFAFYVGWRCVIFRSSKSIGIDQCCFMFLCLAGNWGGCSVCVITVACMYCYGSGSRSSSVNDGLMEK